MRKACLPLIQVSVSPKVMRFWLSGRKVLRPPLLKVVKVLLKLMAVMAEGGEREGARRRRRRRRCRPG